MKKISFVIGLIIALFLFSCSGNLKQVKQDLDATDTVYMAHVNYPDDFPESYKNLDLLLKNAIKRHWPAKKIIIIKEEDHKEGLLFKTYVTLKNGAERFFSDLIPRKVRERREKQIRHIRRRRRRQKRELTDKDKRRIKRLSKTSWTPERYYRDLKVTFYIEQPDKGLMRKKMAGIYSYRSEKWSWRYLDDSDKNNLIKKVRIFLKEDLDPEGVFQKIKNQFVKNIDKLFVKIKKIED